MTPIRILIGQVLMSSGSLSVVPGSPPNGPPPSWDPSRVWAQRGLSC
jgi:hypothetical protein